MEDAVMSMPVDGLFAPGEIPGTGKMVSMKVTSTISVDTMIPSRERSEFFERQLMELSARSVSDWREALSKDDRNHLRSLVRETTNASRLRVLTNKDPRGLVGYLKHAKIPEFPTRLYYCAGLTNASIKSILRAL